MAKLLPRGELNAASRVARARRCDAFPSERVGVSLARRRPRRAARPVPQGRRRTAARVARHWHDGVRELEAAASAPRRRGRRLRHRAARAARASRAPLTPPRRRTGTAREVAALLGRTRADALQFGDWVRTSCATASSSSSATAPEARRASQHTEARAADKEFGLSSGSARAPCCAASRRVGADGAADRRGELASRI